MTKTPPWLAIVAPAFNEGENIEAVVTDWLELLQQSGQPFEIVIANDGSTHDTVKILEQLQTKHTQLKVVSHHPNRGYGYALTQAIRGSSAEYVMTLDSDGQFDAAQYGNLFEQLQKDNADLVTGFRLGKKDSFFKVFADRMLNIIVRLMFGISLRDTNCAQKLGKGSIMRSLTIEAMGYPTPTEIVLKAHAQNFKISEVGVPHREREAGFQNSTLFKPA